MDRVDWIITGSFLLGLALVLGIWRREPPADRVLGDGKYDFRSSWVSNTTVFAAILGTPIKDLEAPAELGVLNVLFLALGGIALLVNAAAARAARDGLQTPVWAFLIASSLSLWAVFGQLATLWFMINDTCEATLSGYPKTVFLATVVVGGACVALFAIKAMRRYLNAAVKPIPPADSGPVAAKSWALL